MEIFIENIALPLYWESLMSLLDIKISEIQIGLEDAGTIDPEIMKEANSLIQDKELEELQSMEKEIQSDPSISD